MQANIKQETIEEFSNLIHLTRDVVGKLIEKPRYKTFKIKKRNGKTREINAPSFELKIIQKWILVNILEQVSISEVSMAFIKNRNGIKENALRHKDSKYIFAIDLKNFYPSISQNMVEKLFLDIGMGFSEDMAKLLSILCTYKGELPQGGITSPLISNLICRELDSHILDFCKLKDVKYSRYADDLTFSSNIKGVLVEIEDAIRKIVHTKSRFKINEEKTRFLSPKSHKKVTGITINHNELKASKKIKQKIRATLYYSIKNNRFLDKYKKDWLVGNIAFVNSIEEDYKNVCIKYIKQLKGKYKTDNDFGLLKILDK